MCKWNGAQGRGRPTPSRLRSKHSVQAVNVHDSRVRAEQRGACVPPHTSVPVRRCVCVCVRAPLECAQHNSASQLHQAAFSLNLLFSTPEQAWKLLLPLTVPSLFCKPQVLGPPALSALSHIFREELVL